MMLIIEIALGIVLGVLILEFLPAILALGVVALIVAIALAILAALIFFARTNPEVIVIPLIVFSIGAVVLLLHQFVRIYRGGSEGSVQSSTAPDANVNSKLPSWRDLDLVGKALLVIFCALIAWLFLMPVWIFVSSLFG